MVESKIQQLRWDVEMTMSSLCWLKEREAKEDGKEYRCDCPDIYKMGTDELQNYLDENKQ